MRHALVLAGLCGVLSAQCFVRTHDTDRVLRSGPHAGGAAPLAAGASVCATLALAWHGQPAPGGGTLSPLAFANPATVNRDGRLAFFAQVGGVLRNQGIFVADGQGVRAIAVGCGAGGGSGNHGTCGDPAPGGGTFAGMFGGTPFVPAQNELGDVLFLADVVGGSSGRGLFLYRADSGTLVKVAAVGDAAPQGGTFHSIGPGSLNNRREIVFLARTANVLTSDLYVWRPGALALFARTGDPAPGGGTYAMLGTESFGFQDGSNIPTGPVPAINDRGEVAFRAITSGGSTSRGIVLAQNGVHRWALRAGDPTPAGGVYQDFWAPHLNAVGGIAVLADYTPATTGWFVGAGTSWRKAISFLDPIDGGMCYGLAASRNPIHPLDDEGNLLFWTDLSSAGGQDRLVLAAPDGTLTIVARRGGATPVGGTFSSLDAWPSLSASGRASFGAGTPGAGGGTIFNARCVALLCGPAVAVLGATAIAGTLRVDDYGPPGAGFGLLASTTTQSLALPPFGTLRLGPGPIVLLLGLTPYPAGTGLHTLRLPVPNDPTLANVRLYLQSLAVQGGTATLTNLAETVLR